MQDKCIINEYIFYQFRPKVDDNEKEHENSERDYAVFLKSESVKESFMIQEMSDNFGFSDMNFSNNFAYEQVTIGFFVLQI
jgi:hypothetical protein